ncbi:MAG: hypothetical protein ABEJ89_03155 [Haloarculaceae archaeon]
MVDIQVGFAGAPDNPSLTFIAFVGLTLLAMLALRFTLYADLNRRATELSDQRRLWRVLVGVGLTGALYALLGLVDIVTTVRTPYRRAVVLALVLFLSVAVWLLYGSAMPATASGPDRSGLRPVALGGALAVAAVLVGAILLGDSVAVSAVEGIAGTVLAGIGLALGYRGVARSRVQGTVVDTLLRHLLPVLLFASLIAVAELAVVAGTLGGVPSLDRAVVLHVQVVFVIMTATALMTATIKLRQNLAGL